MARGKLCDSMISRQVIENKPNKRLIFDVRQGVERVCPVSAIEVWGSCPSRREGGAGYKPERQFPRRLGVGLITVTPSIADGERFN